MITKRSLEDSTSHGSNPVVKKQKNAVKETTNEIIKEEKLKSSKINETILINPALEEKIEVNVSRKLSLQTIDHLGQYFDCLDFALQAPGLFNFTNCGQIPYVTADLLSSSSEEVNIITFQSIMQHPGVSVLENLTKTLSEYMNSSSKLLITPFNSSDPIDLTRFNDQLGMSIWGKSGRLKVTSKEYLHFIKVAKPELFVSLSDVVPATVNKKRADKSCYRTLQLVNEAVALLLESNLKSKLLAPIPGSGHRQLMMKSAYLLSKIDVFGYVIERCTLPISNWQEQVSDIISILPPKKPVIMLGVLNEHEMVEAYLCGCHFVDTSFVTHFSSTGQGLVLNIREPANLHAIGEVTETAKQSTTAANIDFGPSLAENIPHQEQPAPVKSIKENQKVPIFKPVHYLPPNVPFTLDLIKPKYTLQFIPLDEECECFSCKRHTRGYINHLLITNELLAPTLLMLHNLHHAKDLLKQVKTCLQQGTLMHYAQKLRDLFSRDVYQL